MSVAHQTEPPELQSRPTQVPTRGSVLDRLREHAAVLLSVAFVAAVALGVWDFVRLSGTLAEQLTLQDAARSAQAVAQFPALYSPKGAGAGHDKTASAEGLSSLPGAIGLSGSGVGAPVGSWIRLFGKTPLPWRRDGTAKDTFEHEALEHLDKNPETPFTRFEQLDGRHVLRYATPSVMRYSTADAIQPSCLACHNSHPDRITDARAAPDGRGVLEVVVSLDEAVAQTRGRLLGVFALMATLALLASVTLGALARVVGKLKRTSAEALQLAAEQVRANRQLGAEIAERMRAEAEAAEARDQALEASRLKSQFVNNISDGIRTPMNGIVGAVELLAEGELTPAQREYAGIAKSSTEALLVIVNDILDFSKIAYGEFTLQAVDFDLRAVVHKVLDSTRPQAHAKLLELSSEVAPEVPDTLVGDPGRLLQIILNLVDNAIKFTAEGEILVRILLESSTDTDAVLHVEVADTGTGIAPEMQGAIFDAFTQAGTSPVRRQGGLGLGLGICGELVRKMGGRIWVDSRPGKGSRFHFTACFPLGDGTVQAESLAPPELRHMPVLVVDDDPATRRVLVGLLETWEARPTVSESIAAALFALRRSREDGHPIPLVLVNVRLLAAQENHFVHRIRSDLRIADARLVTFGSFCPLGVNASLATPITGADLRRAVRAALSGGHEAAVAASPVESALVPVPEAGSRTDPPRLLVVDDSVMNRQLVAWWLERRGYNVAAAGDGLEAVAVLEQEPFDLVIMDLMMPAMDGIAATRAIRARERETGAHVPIIALTALSREEERRQCFEVGMDAYVTKPVRSQDLLAVIERVLAKHDGQRRMQTSASTTSSELSLEAVRRQAGDDPTTVLSLVEAFLGESRELLQQLRDGCDRRDTAALQQAANQLQGSLAMVGAQPAAAVAAELGRRGAEGNVEGARERLAALERELGRVEPELVSLVGPRL